MYLPRGKMLSRLYSRPRITYRGINKKAVLVCGKLYGRLADVLKTGKPYKVPAHHMEKDYLPELQPGEPGARKTSSSSEPISATMQRWTRYLIRNQTCISPSLLLVSISTESKTILSSQHAFITSTANRMVIQMY